MPKSTLTALLIATTIFLSGCGTAAVSNTPPVMSRAVQGNDYTFRLVKSPTNIVAGTAVIDASTVSMRQLLDTAHTPYTTAMHGQQEVVSMLGSVITTGSKTWYLYINDKPVPLITLDSIMIAPTDTVEWRYEPLH